MHISHFAIAFFHRRERRIQSEIIGFAACGVYILTASTYVAFTKELRTALSPLSMLFLSESLSLLFTVLSFGFLPLLREVLKAPRREILPMLVVAISNSVAAPLLAFIGITKTHAANAALISSTDVLFLFILSTIFLRERVERRQIVSGVVIAAGIATVTFGGFTERVVFNPGDPFILASAITYALGIAIFKKYIRNLHTEAAMFLRGITAISAFLLASLFLEHGMAEELQELTLELMGVLIAYGFFTRFLALFSFYEALERIPAHTISLIVPLVTIGSIIFSRIYLAEQILWYHIVGGACILFGSLVMQFHSHRLSPEEELQRQMQHHRKHL